MSDNSGNSGGISLAGATFIVFLVLKLTRVIDWSWWWVTAPLWIPTALVVAVLIVVGAIAGAVKVLDAAEDKKAEKRRQARLKAASNSRLRRL